MRVHMRGPIRIRVKNSTAWQTKMLLPFIRRIAREEFDGSTPKRTRSMLTVEIVYNRGGKDRSYCTGYGFYNSNLSRIRVPFPHKGRVFPVLDFCFVLGHEFGHNRGLRHADMGWHYGNSCSRPADYHANHYVWAEALPVPVVKAAPKKPSLGEKRAKELKTAEAAVLNWQRKVKLANTKLKLWVKRVRTLEKRIAAGVDTAHAEPLRSAACGTNDADGPSQVTGV